VVQPGAFATTIAAWAARGRPIPLHWNHQSSDPADIIGTVDPGSMRETAKGLVVEAELDLEKSARAREAWRLVKADSVGVSFGYAAETEQLEDGTLTVDEDRPIRGLIDSGADESRRSRPRLEERSKWQCR
jgi:HK97 family phage prohead protease